MQLFYRSIQGDPHTCAWELFADALAALGYAGTDFTLCRSPLGKPYFAEADAPHFSISHTKILVVCAISETPIGVDAEPSDRAVSPAVCRRFLAGCSPADAVTAWTRRESYGTLTGEGVALQTTPFNPTRYRHTTYHVAGHVITVCHQTDDPLAVPQAL